MNSFLLSSLPVESTETIDLYDDLTAPLRGLENQEIPASDNLETRNVKLRNFVLDISACADSLAGVPKFLARAPNRRGDIAEMKFELRAASEDIHTSRPRFHGLTFDFIAWRRRFATVQVKSTYRKDGNSYHVYMIHSKRLYQRGDFDFLAALVVPLDVWYIIPFSAIGRRSMICLHPEGKRHGNAQGLFEKYRERWDLFK